VTYLQLVNAVLSRLREDNVTTVDGNDDVVVLLVKEFVNDAIAMAHDAHTWSALSTEWTFTADSQYHTLTNSADNAIISYIYDDNGVRLREVNKEMLRRRAAQGGSAGTPQYYIVDGKDANGDMKLRLWPAPSTPTTYTAYGYQQQPRLETDTDRLLIPHLPVIYMAHAIAANERGEVGAQTGGELYLFASRYLSDAIAIDAANTDMDNIWTTV